LVFGFFYGFETLATAETGYPIAAYAPMLNTSLAQIMEYTEKAGTYTTDRK
jgi:hypothetical protein